LQRYQAEALTKKLSLLELSKSYSMNQDKMPRMQPVILIDRVSSSEEDYHAYSFRNPTAEK
jgi:hypothetical protein